MKKIFTITIVVIIALFTFSTLFAKKRTDKNRPSWLTNPYSKYPENRYLAVIGEGDSRAKAEANATANLSKIFETVVKSEETVQERYLEISSPNSAESSTMTDISQNISLTSNKTLFNVQYGDSFTDKLGKTYVLAYLDRNETGRIYLERIEENADKIMFFIRSSTETEDVLKKYAYLSAAQVVTRINTELLEQLQIVSPLSKATVMLEYDTNQLTIQAKEAAENLKFSISIENDSDNKITPVLSDLLTCYGFIVNSDGDIKINGSIEIEPVNLKREEQFVRWILNLNVQNSDGSTLISHSQSGREGHVNLSEAVARAYRTADRDIRNDFNKKLLQFFDNLTK